MTALLIKKTAKEMAGAHHEASRSTLFRQQWPNQDRYVNKNWPFFVVAARRTLAEMLARNDIAESSKEEIHRALCEEWNQPVTPLSNEILKRSLRVH